MKKLILVCLSIFVFACSPEEDVIIQNPNEPDPQDVTYVYSISTDGNIDYVDDNANINVSATATPDPSLMRVKLIQGSNDIGGGFYDLMGANGNYNANVSFILSANAVDGPATIELWSLEPGNNSNQPTGESVVVNLEIPDDGDPNDPDPTDCEYVKFTSFERIEVSGSDPRYKFIYEGNTFIDGVVTIQLWKGGVNQNLDFDRVLIDEDGEIETDQISGLITGDNYQWRLINKNGQTPILKFLDDMDDVNESQIFNFVAEDNTTSTVTATVTELVFDNETISGMESTLKFTVDSSDPQTVVAKIYKTSDPNVIVAESAPFTTNGTGPQEYLSVWTGLDSDTEYRVRYFLNGNTDSFFSGVQSTHQDGVHRTEVETTSSTSNTVTVTVEYDNTTGADLPGVITFTGTSVNGGTHIETASFTLVNGNENFDVSFTRAGFKQNTQVTITISVSGIDEGISENVQTMSNVYDPYTLNLGVPMTPGNNTGLLAAIIDVTSNGYANVNTFNLTITSTLDPNLYVDYVRIHKSTDSDQTTNPNQAVVWIETSSGSGVWETTVTQTAAIEPGSNSYNIYLGTENYTVVDTTTGIDILQLSTTITDDNSTPATAGDGSNSVDIPFGM